MALADAVAAMQLHRLVDHLLRLVGGKQLGHRRFAGDAGSAHVLGPGGAIDQKRGGIDIEGHVGDMALHHLQLGHRRAKQFALGHPLDAFIQSAAGKAKCCRADGRPEHVEHRHGDAEAVTRLADQRGSWNADAVEGEARQRMRRDHFQPLGDGQAFRLGRYDEG